MRAFIGSSNEQYPVVKEIKRELKDFSINHKLELVDWKEWFGKCSFVNSYNWDIIESALQSFDFAIMLLAPDDKIECRNENLYSTRDNVLIETGAFVATLGIEKVFLLISNIESYKNPSDFLGLNCIRFDYSRGAENDSAYRKICDRIIQLSEANAEGFESQSHELLKNSNPIRITKGKGKIS